MFRSILLSAPATTRLPRFPRVRVSISMDEVNAGWMCWTATLCRTKAENRYHSSLPPGRKVVLGFSAVGRFRCGDAAPLAPPNIHSAQLSLSLSEDRIWPKSQFSLLLRLSRPATWHLSTIPVLPSTTTTITIYSAAGNKLSLSQQVPNFPPLRDGHALEFFFHPGPITTTYV
ncbi:hypothetical protein Fcan01_03949 [Folsomia candida]|uniref:Uncharacterized protein n=1 Tax=Folsomia candida TaxID=158441 RepID=A0A226EVT7_FOLCA|nr:hypothetical protein Fcan01_03949 [Folsomia candida]